MKNFSRAAAFVAAFAFSLSGAGCVTEPTKTTTDTTTTNTNTTASPTASPTVSTAASPTISPTPVNASNTGLPVTLPVIDAFFAADETFAADLTRRLQLTDAQVDNLRTIARVEKEKLREAETGEYQGSTANAQTLALNRIKEAIGEAKAQQFADFVRERWSTGGEGSEAAAIVTGNTTPNAVPTDTRIVVNAPAYRMDVFRDGQLTKSYKVGIGYPEFPLPTGLRKATTIIYNPTWTPPDEPWVEGSNEVKAGQKVAAGSKLNPLGPVKIPIGSPSLIHGGKTPAKLGSFASHGCVGLTDPQVLELSRVIADISGTELTDEDVAAYTKVKTETKNVKLTQQIPVELRYETIVVEDGKLHIYRDVYDRDTNTEDNLRRVLEAHGVQFDQLSEPKRAQVMTALQRMARDAQGNPTDAASPSPPPSLSPTASSNKNANNSGDRVTRTVKGQKEIVIEMAALKGKGYPAPVNLNTGSAQNKRATASSAQAGKRR